MSDDPHLPTPLAHGRWAGDRVGHSAREAGASLKTLSKRATLTEQQRHRLGSGSFEWRQPEKQRSQRGGLFWTCLLYTSPSPRDLKLSRMPSSA